MKLYLIASTVLKNSVHNFLLDRNHEWLHDDLAGDAEMVSEIAGRVCYMSFGNKQHRRTTQDYIANIIAQGHGSVLEHANFTILADGITRSLSHQLVRHRAGFAYSQLSQQYHDEFGAEFVEPSNLDDNLALRARWNKWKEETMALYAELQSIENLDNVERSSLSNKEKSRYRRSCARLVLPNATTTTLVITGNARAWRHVLSVRGAVAGDVEMREYCVNVFQLLSKEAPSLFMGFELAEDELGSYIHTVAS